eukprot:218534_1
MDRSQWLLTINNEIINEKDPIKFGELLSKKISPPAIIQIIKLPPQQQKTIRNENVNNECHLKINYTLTSMRWKPNTENKDWNIYYDDLINTITKHFQINQFDFKLQDSNHCEILDGDDLNAVWNATINNKKSSLGEIQIIPVINISNEQKQANSADINDITDEMINDMQLEEITSLQSTINHFDKQTNHQLNQSTQFMDWERVCNGINHELWPKIANAVRAIINDKDKPIDKYDFSKDCIDKVMDILKKERYLPNEERQYLRRVLQRAIAFTQITNEQRQRQEMMNSDVTKKAVQTLLLMDIFDVHKIFKFFNFNFKEYDIADYEKDIKTCIEKQGKKALGDVFIEQHINNVTFCDRSNLYPNYVINDDMFQIFDYHFGVSLFINGLKNNLYFGHGSCVEVQSLVISKSISSIYDEDLLFKYSIGRIEEYLVGKKIYDFYKNQLKSGNDIVTAIEQWYNIDVIQKNRICGLMIIVDRRYSHESGYDLLYTFPYENHQRFPELETNHLIGFDFKIKKCIYGKKNKVITYFKYSINQITRFYPEMLVNIIPGMFKRPSGLSEAEFLDKMYDNKFKHGWCVTLDDAVFDKYYKIITQFTHISNNYKRQKLFDDNDNTKWMICFRDLLQYDMDKSYKHSVFASIVSEFLNDNEYDSESIIGDILFQHNPSTSRISNIETLFLKENKQTEFDTFTTILHKYMDHTEKSKQTSCNAMDISPMNECEYINTIMTALSNFKNDRLEIIVDKYDICELLGSYDHIMDVHKLNRENSRSKEQNNKSNDIKTYFIQNLGFCGNKNCSASQRHQTRFRERQQNIDYNEIENNSLTEIISATINGLHCYLLHENKPLFRLEGLGNNNLHFITQDEKTDTENHTIKFGVSVLQWLNYSESPSFNSFREEIINNPESTINTQLFLVFAQECYIKMINSKDDQYMLEELMCLKMYSDTDSYQSSLRKAFWNSSTKKVKKSFYHWAMQLYKTFTFHAKPIPRWSTNSTKPLSLFHGLNMVFVLDNALPIYHGPVSTTLKETVAHSFSQGKGLLLTIRPSYSNKFKFVIGISMSWISHHKHEEEVLLYNQYIPIQRTQTFDTRVDSNVDHLLYSLMSYKKTILDSKQFYKVIGLADRKLHEKLNSEWIDALNKRLELLYYPTAIKSKCIMERVHEELGIKKWSQQYKLMSSKLEFNVYSVFNYYSLKIRDKFKQLSGTEYRLVDCSNQKVMLSFAYDEHILQPYDELKNENFKIEIRNQKMLGINDYVQLQDIDELSFASNNELFGAKLDLQNEQLAVLNVNIYSNEQKNQILKSNFGLICNETYTSHMDHIKRLSATNMKNRSFIYNFKNSSMISFIIPFRKDLDSVDIYAQFENEPLFDFVWIKRLNIKRYSSTSSSKITYLLNMLKLYPNQITNSKDFFKQIECEIKPEDITSIENNPDKLLYESTAIASSKIVLDRLIDELHVNSLSILRDKIHNKAEKDQKALEQSKPQILKQLHDKNDEVVHLKKTLSSLNFALERKNKKISLIRSQSVINLQVEEEEQKHVEKLKRQKTIKKTKSSKSLKKNKSQIQIELNKKDDEITHLTKTITSLNYALQAKNKKISRIESKSQQTINQLKMQLEEMTAKYEQVIRNENT